MNTNIVISIDDISPHDYSGINAINNCMELLKKKYIIIGTTALNRSLLHNNVIPDWYKYINSIDKNKYNIHWFINVDYIEKLNETVDKTKKILQTIIKDIPITFIKKKDENTGNFLEACQNVSSNIEQYVINNKLNPDDVIIFWLEDDWKLESNNIPLQELIEMYMSDMTCIKLNLLLKNYIHSLSPGLLSYKLWSQLHLKAWKNQKEYIDPESCVGLFFLKIYYNYEKINNLTIIKKDSFVDMKFISSIYQDLTRWNFFDKTNSYYTYHSNNKLCEHINKRRYIEKDNVKNITKNKIYFMRIISTCCKDIGRDFMINNRLKKQKNNIKFYKEL